MGANGPCRRHRGCSRKLGQGPAELASSIRPSFACNNMMAPGDGMIARALPIKDGTGAITRWIGTNTDIDDRKAAEAQQQLLTSNSNTA